MSLKNFHNGSSYHYRLPTTYYLLLTAHLVVEELPQRQQGALALAVLVRGILPELVVLVRGRGVVRGCVVRGVARACGKGGGTGVC